MKVKKRKHFQLFLFSVKHKLCSGLEKVFFLVLSFIRLFIVISVHFGLYLFIESDFC